MTYLIVAYIALGICFCYINKNNGVGQTAAMLLYKRNGKVANIWGYLFCILIIFFYPLRIISNLFKINEE